MPRKEVDGPGRRARGRVAALVRAPSRSAVAASSDLARLVRSRRNDAALLTQPDPTRRHTAPELT